MFYDLKNYDIIIIDLNNILMKFAKYVDYLLLNI